MDHLLAVFITLTLTFTVTMVTSTQSGADVTNAQATLVGGGSSSSGGAHDTAARIVKRFTPRFVGKREQDDSETVDTAPATDAASQFGRDTTDFSEFQALDANNADEFIDILKEIEELSSVNKDSQYLSDNGDQLLENEPDSLRLDNYFDETEGDFTNLGDVEDFNEDEFRDEDEDIEQSDMDKRAYRPRFIGKRYRPRFVGKRYIPRFIGKRYQPKFIGKRYIPRFVGKRYQPKFIGKRYIPRFVGKRYQPKFIGKRNYRPRFIGKRYPADIETRGYQPKFIGKRNFVDIDDKRYQPRFVGKRYIPRFIGKRYQPRFVGKRLYAPKFIGKRSDETDTNEADDDIPMVIEKRSADKPDTITIVGDHNSGDAPKSRRKRSIMSADESDDLKRAWGRYVPWQDIPTYKILKVEGPVLDKRFVAPEFIGRRDSISSILSALNALRMARNEPRIASKRFQAPLFIGKRGSELQQTLYWNPEEQDDSDSFSSSPYLSTAMRLTVPGIGRQPSEDEIMKDVENLEPLKFDPASDFHNDQPFWQSNGLNYDNFDLKTGVDSLRSKRYHEFLGKRNENNDDRNSFGENLIKRWNEFVGKRQDGWFNSPELVSKRYIEFIGKREPLRFRIPDKRYAEFLG